MPHNKKGIFLITCLCLLWNSGLAFFYQQHPDTLLKKSIHAASRIEGIKMAKKVLNNAIKDNDGRTVIKSLNTISKLFGYQRLFDSVLIYGNKALAEARNYDIDSFKGDSWIYLGNAYFEKGAFGEALQRYNNAVYEYKRQNLQLALGNAYLNVGVSQRMSSKYDQAIKAYMLAIGIFETLKNDDYLSSAYKSIAVCFNELNNFDKALEYNKKALSIRMRLGVKTDISESCNNIGYLFYKYKQNDSAIYYLSRSLDVIKNNKDSTELVLILQNLSSSWRAKGDIKKAERYASRARRIAEKNKMIDELARGSADLAEIYLAQKKYSQALDAINVTIGTAKKERAPELLLHCYTIKYDIYKQSGDYKNALLYADIKNNLKDTVFNIERDKAVTDAETQYKTLQVEKDRDAFKVQADLREKIVTQQTRYIIVLAFAAILLAILFIIAYKNFQKKNKANERIQTLMRDLHHRVKNNLQILQGLFSMQIDNLSDEKTKNALRENEARLTSMNLIHSRLYLDNTTTKIEMNDYLTKLLNHIKDSFGGYGQNEINLKIEVSNIMLEADKAVAIGLIANELTTNSFKYAFNGAGGEIHLALQMIEKSKILLTLGDNGVGLKPENKDKAPSFGLKLVNLMARQLNSTLVVKSNPGVFYQMEISI